MKSVQFDGRNVRYDWLTLKDSEVHCFEEAQLVDKINYGLCWGDDIWYLAWSVFPGLL